MLTVGHKYTMRKLRSFEPCVSVRSTECMIMPRKCNPSDGLFIVDQTLSNPISIPSITCLMLFCRPPSHFCYEPSALCGFVTGCLPSIYQQIWGYSTSSERIQTLSMKRPLDLPKMGIPAMKLKRSSPRTDGVSIFLSPESVDYLSCHL